MNIGSRFDVNNSIGIGSAYPGYRAAGYTPPSANRFRTRNNSAGELGALNQDAGAQMVATGGPSTPSMSGGGATFIGQPAKWWIGFVVVFALFVWVSRRFNGGEKFTNIKLSVYNGIFLTIFIVLILNLLKVFAARFPIPGLSALILAA